jgi:hypothetical protein
VSTLHRKVMAAHAIVSTETLVRLLSVLADNGDPDARLAANDFRAVLSRQCKEWRRLMSPKATDAEVIASARGWLVENMAGLSSDPATTER